MLNTKKCSCCQKFLPLPEFTKRASAKDGLQHHCKTCKAAYTQSWAKRNAESLASRNRDKHLARTYGLSQEGYETLLALQGGVCAICKRAATAKAFHVDHDHTSGNVRGLLCDNCNRGLGCFKDDIERLASAIAYVSKL